MKHILATFLALFLLTGAAGAESTFTGNAQGFGGEVRAQVSVDETGKITALTIDAASETPAIGGAAVQTLTEAILASGSADVDAVAQATVTSNAVLDAVHAALVEAGVREGDDTLSYVPGVYTGKAFGRMDEVTVSVSVSADRIEKIDVVQSNEFPILSDRVFETVIPDIIANQSLAVDTVTGATVTSSAILSATADALAQAGANLSVLRSAPVAAKPLPAAQDMDTQIVVAGGGLAGMMAALSAADQGADVILVEKLSYLGGSFGLSNGGFAVANSQVVRDMGIDDSLDRIFVWMRQMNETSEMDMDYDLASSIIARSGATMDYLVNRFGYELQAADRGYYTRGTFGSGAETTQMLEKSLAEVGVTVLTETTAREIVMEGEKAVGLTCENAGGSFTIHADKVIIATGGANYNEALMLEGNPELAVVDLFDETSIGNSGDGFVMLERIGAKMGPGPRIKSAAPDYAAAFHLYYLTNQDPAKNLLVNADGERFTNESPVNGSVMLNKYMLREASPAYYVIFDTVHTDESFLSKMQALAPQENRKIVVYAETIEELAVKMGVEPATLRATFDRYQALCEKGVDEDFGKAAEHLVPYAAQGGYYAAYLMPAAWGTFGGAITDDTFHVLREDGSIIENVFAAGEAATSTLFADYYFGSFSLGYYATMGRVASETAAAELAQQ